MDIASLNPKELSNGQVDLSLLLKGDFLKAESVRPLWRECRWRRKGWSRNQALGVVRGEWTVKEAGEKKSKSLCYHGNEERKVSKRSIHFC